jgi:hypothetical protein
MTKKEWFDYLDKEALKDESADMINPMTGKAYKETVKPASQQPLAKQEHREAVKQALSEGKPVPADVLKDYPGLPQAKAPLTATKEQILSAIDSSSEAKINSLFEKSSEKPQIVKHTNPSGKVLYQANLTPHFDPGSPKYATALEAKKEYLRNYIKPTPSVEAKAPQTVTQTEKPAVTEPKIAPKEAVQKVEEKPTIEVKPVETTEPTTTSIKHAVTTAERAERGLPEVEREIRRTIPIFEEGKRLVESGERDPRALAQELVDKPRTHTPEEAAMLLYDRMRIKNEHKTAMESVEKAIDAGNTIAEAEARVKLRAVEDAYSLNDTAARQSGTEWSAAGRMRQLTIKEDYSLAELVRRYKVETGQKEVPATMRTKLEGFAKQIEELDTKLKAREEKITELQAAKAVERVKEEVKRETRKAVRTASKQDLSVEFDVLNKELNKLLGGRLSSGLDPAAVLILGKMAKNRVKSGIITVEGIVDSIHSSIKDMGLEISKRDIRDAISGYGITAQMSKEAIAVQLREVKRQMRLISAYEDATSGQAPLRSGLQRDLPSDTVRELTRKVQDMVREQGIDLKEGKTPEEKWRTAVQSYKTRMTHQISDLEKKLATGDFTKKEKRVTELDQEGLDLQFKRDKTIRAYHEAMFKDQRSRRNIFQKVGAGIGEVMNLSRALKTSFDLSAVLRQGGFIALGHPIRAAKSFPAMFKALLSDQGRFAVEQKILQRPNYRLYEQSKLYLAEHGKKLSQMEEVYMSRWAEKIPGVAASQRAYTTFLNELRADSFDTMAQSLSAKGTPTMPELTAISNYINVVTGRGNLGNKQNALVGLNTVFFAPRYVASRFQTLAGQPLYQGTARTRVMVAKEYARFLAGLGVVYSLGLAAGAEVQTDPRSSDFGKIKFGNVRVDPLLGLSQVTVLASRLITGESKNSKGKIVPIRGEKVPYGGSNSADVVARFLRSKLSPVVGTGVDIVSGKDVVGQPVTAQGMPEKLLMPLAFNDIYTSMKELGVPAASALSVLSIFGMGLQTYDPNKRTR